MPYEEFIYNDTDSIEDIFFLVRGSAAFVIPSLDNIVYIEIEPGDKFGEIDIQYACLQSGENMDDFILKIH